MWRHIRYTLEPSEFSLLAGRNTPSPSRTLHGPSVLYPALLIELSKAIKQNPPTLVVLSVPIYLSVYKLWHATSKCHPSTSTRNSLRLPNGYVPSNCTRARGCRSQITASKAGPSILAAFSPPSTDLSQRSASLLPSSRRKRRKTPS